MSFKLEFRRTKGVIGILLATLLLFVSTLVVAPAPAQACIAFGCEEHHDVIVQPINNDENEIWAFVAGIFAGIVTVFTITREFFALLNYLMAEW
jgi:hypothetical protein